MEVGDRPGLAPGQSVERETLELVQYAVQHEMERFQMRDANFKLDMHIGFARNLVATLRAHIYCDRETVTGTETFKYPATWWDALKARWFPRWALKRWPVTMKRVVMEVHARRLYPDVPRLGQRIEVERVTRADSLYREGGG